MNNSQTNENLVVKPRRRKYIWITIVSVGVTLLIIGLAVGLPLGLDDADLTDKTLVECDVAILGAGFAGTYAAYQLATRYRDRLCFIEKLDRFGGRIYDVSGWPSGPSFGAGALRVTASQPTMLALARELGIELQREENDNELMRVRGKYFYRDVANEASESTKMCKELFHNVTCDYSAYPNDADKAMLSKLLDTYNTNKSIAYEYADFPHYISSFFGDEGLAFIRESVRYNSPFTSVSVHGILDFFNNELSDKGLDPDRFYPVGGMSQFIIRMLEYANKSNIRSFPNEGVLKIDFDSSMSMKHSGIFKIVTNRRTFHAKSVLCAIDPRNLRDVKGNIVESIRTTPEFNVILPKTLAIITAWWHERWWEKSDLYRNLSRVVSHENCFNTMDIPTFPYGRNQNVTRAVYDDGACVDMWQTLVNTQNNEMLAKTVSASLSNVFTDVKVPLPKALHGFVHENAWHFQISNSNTTNKQVFEWSQRPFTDRNFFLIGEAYNLDFSAWCDGALKSTMWVLSKHFGFTFPCVNDTGSPAVCDSNLHMRNREYKKMIHDFRFG